MLDQDTLATLLTSSFRALGVSPLYWAMMALVATDVGTGVAQAHAKKDLDPGMVARAGHKFLQSTAAIGACYAMAKMSPALEATTVPILGTIAAAEGMSVLGNLRRFWEARGETPPEWIDALTIFLRGFPATPGTPSVTQESANPPQAPAAAAPQGQGD